MVTARKGKSSDGSRRRQGAPMPPSEERDEAGADAEVEVTAERPERGSRKPAAEVPQPLDPLIDFFVSDEEAESNTQLGADESFSANLRSRVMAELLAFWVADEEYAIDIVEIQEIMKVPAITEVPRTPTSVLGIISLRGTIVPVIDLRVILDLERRDICNASRILVMRGDGEPVGLLVDQVSSVVRIDRESIEPPPRSMRRDADELLLGVGKDGDRMLIVLDLPAVLNALENAA